jgi:hypothetical protein
MEIANQFKGLPMESLIGGPLKAACDANQQMARATSNFITEVGFIPVVDDEGKVTPGAPRMVDFSFERPGVDQEGAPTIEMVKLKVPILAVVPIPNLQVNTVDVTFDMEVKNSTSATEKVGTEASLEVGASAGYGPFSASIKISGSVSASKENTRTSDASAKYHVAINAQNFGIPEGLSRVLDMMNQAAAPRRIEQYKPNALGEINRDEKGNPTETPVLLDNADAVTSESAA